MKPNNKRKFKNKKIKNKKIIKINSLLLYQIYKVKWLKKIHQKLNLKLRIHLNKYEEV